MHTHTNRGGTIVMFHYRMRNERHASHATEICRGKLSFSWLLRRAVLDSWRSVIMIVVMMMHSERSRPFVTMWHSIQHILPGELTQLKTIPKIAKQYQLIKNSSFFIITLPQNLCFTNFWVTFIQFTLKPNLLTNESLKVSFLPSFEWFALKNE